MIENSHLWINVIYSSTNNSNLFIYLFWWEGTTQLDCYHLQFDLVYVTDDTMSPVVQPFSTTDTSFLSSFLCLLANLFPYFLSDNLHQTPGIQGTHYITQVISSTLWLLLPINRPSTQVALIKYNTSWIFSSSLLIWYQFDYSTPAPRKKGSYFHWSTIYSLIDNINLMCKRWI